MAPSGGEIIFYLDGVEYYNSGYDREVAVQSSSIQDPSKEGYVFKGWRVTSAGVGTTIVLKNGTIIGYSELRNSLIDNNTVDYYRTGDGSFYLSAEFGQKTPTISQLYVDGVIYDIKDNASPASKITDDNITDWNSKGTYSKPSGGIPKTDLASEVQTSLGKADSALQSFTETDPTVPAHVKSITQTNINNWNAKGTYSKPSGGIPSTDLSNAVQSSLVLADSALQTETDPTVPSHVKSITQANITSWNNKFDLPTGGTEGQVLTKTSTGTGWEDPAKGGSSLDVLLQTAYDNLSDAEKMDGTFRFIYIEQES